MLVEPCDETGVLTSVEAGINTSGVCVVGVVGTSVGTGVTTSVADLASLGTTGLDVMWVCVLDVVLSPVVRGTRSLTCFHCFPDDFIEIG